MTTIKDAENATYICEFIFMSTVMFVFTVIDYFLDIMNIHRIR